MRSRRSGRLVARSLQSVVRKALGVFERRGLAKVIPLDVQARTGVLEGAGALVDEIAAACGPTEAALRAVLTSD